MKTIRLVATGVANLASVSAAFERIGFVVETTDDRTTVLETDYLVVPGVGSFAAAMTELRSRGIDEAIRDRVLAGRPTLGICLGLQLLGVASEESPGVQGLGILPGAVVTAMSSDELPMPQMGWNDVKSCSRFFDSGVAYFANSYAFSEVPDGWLAATYNYDTTYVAAVERGDVLACQFHPELSGDWGMSLLEQWGTSC